MWASGKLLHTLLKPNQANNTTLFLCMNFWVGLGFLPNYMDKCPSTGAIIFQLF